MTKEEAIKILKKYIENDDFYNIYKKENKNGEIGGTYIDFCNAIETVLNMLKEKDKIIENFERELDKISKRNVDLINKYTELKLILAYICRIGISIDDVEIEKFIKEANNFKIRVERDVANRRTIYKTIF